MHQNLIAPTYQSQAFHKETISESVIFTSLLLSPDSIQSSITTGNVNGEDGGVIVVLSRFVASDDIGLRFGKGGIREGDRLLPYSSCNMFTTSPRNVFVTGSSVESSITGL